MEGCSDWVGVGESNNPHGVVTLDGERMVRAVHKFTLVDQSERGRHMVKGVRRDQGPVKTSCITQVSDAFSSMSNYWLTPPSSLPLTTLKSSF